VSVNGTIRVTFKSDEKRGSSTVAVLQKRGTGTFKKKKKHHTKYDHVPEGEQPFVTDQRRGRQHRPRKKKKRGKANVVKHGAGGRETQTKRLRGKRRKCTSE